MQVHQELVADLLTSGHVPHALRFLHDTIGLGRPYMGHFRYHGTLGAPLLALYKRIYVCVLVLLLYVCRHAITLALYSTRALLYILLLYVVVYILYSICYYYMYVVTCYCTSALLYTRSRSSMCPRTTAIYAPSCY
jgi:hypothetical protein